MGKKSGGAAPAAPDPAKTAAAQAATNISTAQANSVLNNVNQITPDGTLTYTQTGNQFISDPTSGQTYWRGPNGEMQSSRPTVAGSAPASSGAFKPVNITGMNGSQIAALNASQNQPQYADGWSQVKGYYIPQTTATTTLSAAQQAIKDQNDKASLNLGTIANQQSSFLKDYLSKPVSLDNDAVESRLYELGRKRLDPMLADRTASLQTQLSNQGIKLGSTAYQKALEADTQGGNDAYNSLLLNGRQQSISEILAQRNQPLNEISALMSGSQVSQPQWAQTAQSNIPTVDYAGLVQSNYQAQMQAYQAAQASKQSTLGGLFGLGSSLLGNTSLFKRRA